MIKKINVLKILILLLTVVLCVSFIVYINDDIYQVAALSSMGSRGPEVKAIQQELKDRGLYKGSVDGIYGQQTKDAVIKFQKQKVFLPMESPARKP